MLLCTTDACKAPSSTGVCLAAGFSQGSVAAALFMAELQRQSRQSSLKFAILVSKAGTDMRHPSRLLCSALQAFSCETVTLQVQVSSPTPTEEGA